MKRLMLAFLLFFILVGVAFGATDLTGKFVWILEDAATTYTIPSAYKGGFYIDWILWTGCTTNGHNFDLYEAYNESVIIIDDSGAAGEDHVFYDLGGPYFGLYINNLDSGRLIIKVRSAVLR